MAVAVPEVLAVTFLVVVMKDPVANPTFTVTDLGTFAAVTEDFSLTSWALAPEPGTASSCTVPISLAPPFTVDGDSVKLTIWKGLTVSVAVCELVPKVALEPDHCRAFRLFEVSPDCIMNHRL